MNRNSAPQGPRGRGGSESYRRTDDRDRDPTRRPEPYRSSRDSPYSNRGLRDDRGGPPRGDRDERSRASGGDRYDRSRVPGVERRDRNEPPRGGRGDTGTIPPRGSRDDRVPPKDDRGYPRTSRDDRSGLFRGARDDRSGASRGYDNRVEPHRGFRDDRGPPPRSGRDDRGFLRGGRDAARPFERGGNSTSRALPRERDTRGSTREEDLSKVVSLDKLERPNPSKWDLPAKGFEEIPAERAKLIGLFQKPGTRKLHVDYNKLLSLLHGNTDLYSSGLNDITRLLIESSRINLVDARKSKTVLVSNVNFSEVTPEEVTQYINNFIITLDIDDHHSKDNVIAGHRLQDKTLIVEFINAAVTTIAVSLNGQLLPNTEVKLKITRPGGFIAQGAVPHSVENTESTEISENVEENFEKVALTNIPKSKTSEEIVELVQLVTASKLKSFRLLKNQLTQESSGIAFLSFTDSALSLVNVRKLHGHKFDANRLNCFKVCDSPLKQDVPLNYFNFPEAVIGKITPLNPPSKVVQFLNCIDFKDFSSEKIYEGLKKDFRDQCSLCGEVLEVTIPKPVDIFKAAIFQSEPGVGKVYVKFASVESSKLALDKLGGYKFGERTVLAAFFNEQDYNLQLW